MTKRAFWQVFVLLGCASSWFELRHLNNKAEAAPMGEISYNLKEKPRGLMKEVYPLPENPAIDRGLLIGSA